MRTSPKAAFGLMSIVATAAIAIAPAADAGSPCPEEWYRKTQALVQSLLPLGGQPVHPDNDIIAAPADVDPQMALVPPEASAAAMRIIGPRNFD